MLHPFRNAAVTCFLLMLALCLPGTQIQWSGWIYFSMAVLVPLHRACFGRKPE